VILNREVVDEIWRLRLDGQVDAAMTLFSKLRQTHPLLQERIDSTQLQKILSSPEADLYLDLIVFQASLARFQKRIDEFKRILLLVENETAAVSFPRPYWLVFENAIYAYRQGDFSSALDTFFLAADKARTPFERLVSKINFACCLYSLGQSFEQTLQECKALLKILKANQPQHVLASVEEQQTALELFSFFRLGQFENILKANTQKGSPSDFLKAWCMQLPYHRFFSKTGLGEAMLSFSKTTCLEPAYRQRTLLGLTHPSDDTPPRLSDWADRLYLWVWRWLVSPDTFPIEKVLATLTPLKQSDQLSKLSVSDRKLVRNALLWLGLFDSSSRRVLQSLLKLVEASELNHYPLLEGERLFIHYWMNLRDLQLEAAKDYLTELEQSPFLNHPDFYFKKLLGPKLSSTDPLVHLWERLKRLRVTTQENGAALVIDFETFKITNAHSKKETISEPIVYAMEALKETGVASFEKLAALCFGISRFDSVTHATKIFNLVSRMKTVFAPFLIFQTKNKKVYVKGDLSLIRFENLSSKDSSLFSRMPWREIVYSRMQSPTSERNPLALPLDLAKSPDPLLSREQLEKLCGRSRASTGRMLQSWEKKGWVKKVGNARATRYRISDFLQNELKEGRLVV